MEKVIRVNWTEIAQKHLIDVYEFHKEYSEAKAFELVTNIVKKADKIVFPKQYQVDEYNPKYRRMIFGDYKILFREKKNIVYIMGVFPTKNDPSKLEKL